MTHTISKPLAHLRTFPQFVICRFLPSVARPGKTDKIPVDPVTGDKCSAMDPANWMAADAAEAAAHRLGQTYGIGFVLTPATGVFCVDIDGALQADNTWSPLALSLCARFPGAAVEVSQSGTGLHIWGTYEGVEPLHTMKNAELGLELYTAKRFIALGGDATGDAFSSHLPALQAVIAELFPPAAPRIAPTPTGAPAMSDEEVLHLWLASAPAVSSLDGFATPVELYEADETALARKYPDDAGGQGRPSDRSRVDAAAARGLAYFTRDAEQIERILRGSALARDKWDEHKSYLARTIQSAIESQEASYSPRTGRSADAATLFASAVVAAPAGMVTEAPASRQTAVEADTFEYSDDALAQIFVERHPEIRWIPGIGWMRDNSQILEPDDGLKRFDLVRNICRAAAASSLVTAPAERKRIASTKTVSAVLTMAQSSVVVHSRQLDNDSLALNTPGGIVELRTGVLRLRRADEFVTQIAGAAPVGGAHPVWDKFLTGVSCGDVAWIEFLQRSMGYWATGDRREQHLWFLYGRGANGKSVLLDFVKWIFGSYAHKLPASALMTPKAERHPTELAGLRGKRLVVSSELDEGAYFNESLLKELTGDQTLTARFMRGDFFEFDMTHKHVIVGNFRPRLRGGDPAMARRMLLVPFNATFQGAQRDPEILAKLKTEAPAILAWIVEGARKWHESGLAIPASVRDASAEYLEEHDDTALWLSECCERDATASTSAATLYASFRNWKTARGEHAPSQTAWGPRLTLMPGVEKRKSCGVIVYAGIRFRINLGGEGG